MISVPKMCVEKYLKDNKDNILHLALKINARIFFLGHYQFLQAHSFPQALLSESCTLLGAGFMSEDKYPSIFFRQMETIVYI